VNVTYRDSHVFSTVAPSSGAVVFSILKIFERYPTTAKVHDPEYDITAHRLIQATRFCYGRRANYGDLAYTANVSTLERLVAMGLGDPWADADIRTSSSEFPEDSMTQYIQTHITTTSHPAPFVRLSFDVSELVGIDPWPHSTMFSTILSWTIAAPSIWQLLIGGVASSRSPRLSHILHIVGESISNVDRSHLAINWY